MPLKIRIMRETAGKETPTDIVRDQDQIRTRLQAMLGQELSTGKRLYAIPKFKHTRKEIHDALDRALDAFFDEFRDETIALK